MPLSAGTRLGPYEIVASLGEGGMGQVYRARDTKLGRDVAIKVLPDLFASDPDRVVRFEREAKTLAALNHQNIAHVYDAGKTTPEKTEVVFLVMELVEGEDLSATIERGAIPYQDWLPIARQIADALEAAHEAGIIHRDLKPANIKVRTDGAVKVLDFGLAKLAGPADMSGSTLSGAGATMTSPAMTGLGVILGTASYMSPEQAKGRAVDKRADIWAFGAVCYEMLTGKAPFPGETMTDVIAAVVTREPDWTLLPKTTPPAVRRLIARCLEKDPKQRLRDIGEVRLALAGDLTTGESVAPASRTLSSSLGWIAAAVFLVLLGASLFWPRGSAPSSPSPLVKFEIAPAGKSSPRLDSRPAVAISPDGSTIVFSATAEGVTKLYVRRRDGTELRVLPGTEGGTDPVFSPDGKWLGFVGPTDLMRMALDGSPVPIAKVNDPRGVTWLDDTQLVLSADTVSGLVLVPASGGPAKPLTTLDPKIDDRTHRWPVAVPGGKAVLFTVGKISSPDNYDDSRIDALIVATGERRTVMEGASFVRVLPHGLLAYAKAGTLFVVPFDSERLTTSGTAVPVLQEVSTDTTTGAAHIAFSMDGSVAYVPGGTSTIDRQIVSVDRKGGTTPVGLPPRLYNDLRISPDGNRIAVLIGSSGSGDIWIYDTHSTSFTPFTFDKTNSTPVWSRDSKSLYYPSLKANGQETTLYRRPIDGSREAVAIGSVKTRAFLEAVDPKEETAFFGAYELRTGGLIDIITMQIKSGATSVLAGGRGSQLASAVSPDGRWLAYQSDEGGRPEIYVRDLTSAGARWPVSTTGGEEPHWSTDGDEIFYRTDTQFMSATVTTSQGFRSNPPTLLFEGVYNLRSDTGMTYDVHPKTGRFVMLRPAGQTPGVTNRVRVILNWLDHVRRGQK